MLAVMRSAAGGMVSASPWGTTGADSLAFDFAARNGGVGVASRKFMDEYAKGLDGKWKQAEET